LARRHGADDETLESLGDLDRSPLPECEREALRFAEAMTRDASSIDETWIVRLRDHFSDDQIVEMACVIGVFNYLNRFAEAMGLWPTRPGEGGPAESA
jgi:alkylhydroperoxidase family enzyme